MAEAKLNPREKAKLAEEQQRKKTRAKYTAVGIVLVLMLALVLFVNSSLFSDGLAALKVDGNKYTVADVNYAYQSNYMRFRQSYGDYISMFIDTNLPLSDQACAFMSEGSWDDYFKDLAESTLVENGTYYRAAVAEGYELTEAEKTQIDSMVENYALYAEVYGYTVDGYIAANFGAGNNEETFRRHMAEELIIERYMEDIYESFSYTDDEKDAYYAENADTMNKVSYLYYNASVEEEDLTGAILAAMENPISVTADEDVAVVVEDAAAEEIALTGEDAFRAAVLAVTESEANETSVSVESFLAQFEGAATAETLAEGFSFTYENDTTRYLVYVQGIDENDYHPVSVRHILVKAVDEDSDGVYSDEEKAAALSAIEEIAAEWMAGDATEDSFAALAIERSEDAGSAEYGGIYEDVYRGQMVTEFDEFCFAGHAAGDTGIVYGESTAYAGYHFIYFVGESESPYSRTLAENALRSADYNAAIEELTGSITSERTFMWRYVMNG